MNKPKDLTDKQFDVLVVAIKRTFGGFYTTTVTGTVPPQTAKALAARGYVTTNGDGYYRVTEKARALVYWTH